MNLNDTRELLWLTGGLYGTALLFGLFKTFKVTSAFREVPLILISLGFVIHTRALYLRGLDVHGCPLGNTLERAQFILWSLILAFLILRFIWRLDLLGSFCAGLSFCIGWITLLFPGFDTAYWLKDDYQKLFSSPWIELHASIAIFSYGLFSLLSIVCSMYLLQRKALLKRSFNKFSTFLPPIHDLEHAAFRLLLIGTLCLSLSIVVGAMHWMQDPEYVTSTKLFISIILWLGYCTLFFLRYSNLLFGSKFCKASIGLFLIAMISMGFLNSKERAMSRPQPLTSQIELK